MPSQTKNLHSFAGMDAAQSQVEIIDVEEVMRLDQLHHARPSSLRDILSTLPQLNQEPRPLENAHERWLELLGEHASFAVFDDQNLDAWVDVVTEDVAAFDHLLQEPEIPEY
jgi:hypothetical protein